MNDEIFEFDDDFEDDYQLYYRMMSFFDAYDEEVMF